MNKQKKEVFIRLMDKDDVPRVAELEAEIFSLPWSSNSFLKALTYPEQLLLVAESDISSGEPVQIAAGGLICGYGVLFMAADQADVSNIAVDPAWRGLGIGDRLMEEMLTRARMAGVREVFLEVRQSNEPAIGLYEKYGFYQVSVRKGYYEEPKEDALLMKAELV